MTALNWRLQSRTFAREGTKDRGALTQLLFPPPDGVPQGRGGADVVEGADFKVVGGVGEDERGLVLRGAERVPGGLSRRFADGHAEAVVRVFA